MPAPIITMPGEWGGDGEEEGGEACGFVDDDAAGKVMHADGAKDAVVGQRSTAPDPVGDGGINGEHPEGGEEEDKAEAHAFHIGPDDQGGGDDGEGHLEGEEQDFGQGSAQGVGGDAGQEGKSQAAPPLARAKGDGIAAGEPQDGHQRRDGKAMGKDRQHVPAAHQTAVKQGKTRQGHEQHQGCGDQNKGSVCGVHGVPLMVWPRCRDSFARKSGKWVGGRVKTGQIPKW